MDLPKSQHYGRPTSTHRPRGHEIWWVTGYGVPCPQVVWSVSPVFRFPGFRTWGVSEPRRTDAGDGDCRLDGRDRYPDGTWRHTELFGTPGRIHMVGSSTFHLGGTDDDCDRKYLGEVLGPLIGRKGRWRSWVYVVDRRTPNRTRCTVTVVSVQRDPRALDRVTPGYSDDTLYVTDVYDDYPDFWPYRYRR